jgi:hypothetical protein
MYYVAFRDGSTNVPMSTSRLPNRQNVDKMTPLTARQGLGDSQHKLGYAM